MGDITRNFSLSEFDCRDGTPVPADLVPNVEALCKHVLQKIRDRWGATVAESTLTVVSGYRTLQHNTNVGGEDNSWHMQAKAADIRPAFRSDVARLHRLVLKMHRDGELPKLGGLGAYPGWIHVDTAIPTDGHLRRWGSVEPGK